MIKKNTTITIKHNGGHGESNIHTHTGGLYAKKTLNRN